MTQIFTPRELRRGRYLESVQGDCLENIGIVIPHGAYAIVDCTIRPVVGDLVCCTKAIGSQSKYLKQVKEIRGDVVVVGTSYTNSGLDYTFEAAEVYGVVTEVFCKMHHSQIYCRK